MRSYIFFSVIAAGGTFASPFAPQALASKHKHVGVFEARAVFKPLLEEEPLIDRHQNALVRRQGSFAVSSTSGSSPFDQVQADTNSNGNSEDPVDDYSLSITGGNQGNRNTIGSGTQPSGNTLATRPGSKLAAEQSTDNTTDVSTNTVGNDDGTGNTTESTGGTPGANQDTTTTPSQEDTTTTPGGCAHEQGIPQSFCPSNTPAVQRLKSRHLKSLPRQQPSSSSPSSTPSSSGSTDYLLTLNSYRSKFCLPPLTRSPALEANAATQGTISHGSVRSMTESACPGEAQVMAGGSAQNFDLAMRVWVCEVTTSNVDHQGCVDAWCAYGFRWTERGHFDLLVGGKAGGYTSVGCASTALEGGGMGSWRRRLRGCGLVRWGGGEWGL
ncbi:MAG: hypothetical protein OHK93_004577 [Ramalina farinacea]|uniref:Uncharacterized protein n=1 Tax=Ramalina farinacea TaxID=258253 RepID=A0AA43TYV0_9LECA|nr:hypothetical protein [Ramalina farinacea]